jgi:hypothetical protein
LLGGSVSEAGDINADGIHDVLIGAIWANPGGLGNAGETYVLFGAAGPFAPELTPADLDGGNGFMLAGIAAGDISGLSVTSVGDMNGDGFDDLAIGASQAAPQGLDAAGEVYVVFGGPGVGSTGSLPLSTLDGSNGFVLQGLEASDNTGQLVAPAGDVNGDGLGDLLLGAYKADPGGRSEAGKAYVVFGASGIGASGTVSLAALDGSNGFVVNGAIAGDGLTRNTSFGAPLGDINGDGADDLLIGASGANPAPEPGGESYVIFGRAPDTDEDGIADRLDNCTLIANVDQRDTNGDGYGNACDPDLNNDNFVNFSDLGILKSVFFTTDPDADFNGDSAVNFVDLGTMKAFFFLPPGPSGLRAHRHR